MLFLQANINNFLLIVISIVVYFFFGSITSVIPLFLVIILWYADIAIYNISFEYQRITLVLSRIAKADNSHFSITQLQLLMTNSKIVPFMMADALISGVIIAYLLHTSVFILIIFLLTKYVFCVFIPTYKPYKLLFRYVGQELEKNDLNNPQVYMEKIRISKLYSDMPQNKDYEQWAHNKYQIK